MNLGDVPLVLVVDDDPDQLALVRQAAARAGGLRIMSAESGAEALAQLEARETMRLSAPDLVLTDLKMPDMSGLELMRILRERSEMLSVPVLFLTSSGYNRDRILVHMAGADGFFEKPIRFGDLIAMMKVLPSYIRHQSDSELPESVDAATPAACPDWGR